MMLIRRAIFDLKTRILVSRFWWLYPGCIIAFLRNPVRWLRILSRLERLERDYFARKNRERKGKA